MNSSLCRRGVLNVWTNAGRDWCTCTQPPACGNAGRDLVVEKQEQAPVTLKRCAAQLHDVQCLWLAGVCLVHIALPYYVLLY